MADIYVQGEDNSDSLDFVPLFPGFEYLNFFGFGGSLNRNLIADKPRPAIVGSPVVNAGGWAEFTGNSHYLRLTTMETPIVTLLSIGRGVGVGATPARPMFISNFSGSGLGNVGTSLYVQNETEIGGTVGVSNGGASVSITAKETQPVGDWGARLVKVTASEITYMDVTAGITKVSAIPYTRSPGTRAYRIGSSYSPNYAGRNDQIAAGIMSIAPSAGMIQDLIGSFREITADVAVAY